MIATRRYGPTRNKKRGSVRETYSARGTSLGEQDPCHLRPVIRTRSEISTLQYSAVVVQGSSRQSHLPTVTRPGTPRPTAGSDQSRVGRGHDFQDSRLPISFFADPLGCEAKGRKATCSMRNGRIWHQERIGFGLLSGTQSWPVEPSPTSHNWIGCFSRGVAVAQIVPLRHSRWRSLVVPISAVGGLRALRDQVHSFAEIAICRK